MSSISKEQRETLALIDAIMAMTEKMPTDESLNVNLSLNPFKFLMDIILKKVSYQEMLDFLVDVMTVSLPVIELGIKGIILSNLKSVVDCNIDPRIPIWLRYPNKGLNFNVGMLDYLKIMSIPPLSPLGSTYYFGTKTYYTIDGDKDTNQKYVSLPFACESCVKQGIPITKIKKYSECSNVYELARAEDYNAFLWFVIHKGFLPVPKETKEIYGVYEGSEDLTENKPNPSYTPRYNIT